MIFDLYYGFSLVTVLALLIYCANVLYAKKFRKTLIGVVIKPGSPEHKKLLKAVGITHLAVALVVTLAAIVNLYFSIAQISHAHSGSYAKTVILLTSTLVFVVTVGVLIGLRNIYGESPVRKRPTDNDDSDW